MLNKVLHLLITAFLFHACTVNASTAKAVPGIAAQRVFEGCIASVNARSVPVEILLRDLGEHCRVGIVRRGGNHLPQPVSISFNNLPLEQAVKKLLRAAGIHNYLIRYHGGKACRPVIAEIIILGCGDGPEAAASPAEPPAEPEQPGVGDHPNPFYSGRETFSEKLASFKERYVWENGETLKRAVWLLEAMPDEAKASGLDGIMRALDGNSNPERGAAVDNEQFYRAIEAAAPPGLAPAMMEQVRRLSERYSNGRAVDKAAAPHEGFYPDLAAEGRR